MTATYPGKTIKPAALLRHGGLILLTLLLGACSDTGQPTTPLTASPPQINTDLQAYNSLVNAQTRKSLIFAEALRLSTEQFLATPDESQQQALQAAWLKAHNAFVAVAALAALDPEAPLLFQIDAWPIQPGYLDSLPAYPDSGLISDVTVAISKESLREQHGFTDSQEVSLGFHAMEYLVFARPAADFAILSGSTDGAALNSVQNPIGDVVTGADENAPQAGEETEADPAGAVAANVVPRRRETLRILAELINLDLNQLVTDINSTMADNPTNVAPARLRNIIVYSRHTSDMALAACHQLLAQEPGHGAFSNSSAEILQLTLTGLQQVFYQPADLAQSLATLAPRAASDFQATLAEAQGLSSRPGPASEADYARLTLLVAALPHQLDDLAAALQGQPAGQ